MKLEEKNLVQVFYGIT